MHVRFYKMAFIDRDKSRCSPSLSYFAAPVRLMNLSRRFSCSETIFRSGQVRDFAVVDTHGLTNGHSSHTVQQVSKVAGELSLGLEPSKDADPGLLPGDWQTVPY